MAEFHDLSEIALNSPGENWGNLGYWQHENDYSAACRALAILLGDSAGLDDHSVVMDVGFGCGDQLLLWRGHYHVQTLCGINYSRSQTALAQERMVAAGYADDAAALHYGDIDDDACWALSKPGKPINRILALDCAYHFTSRQRFFERAATVLAPPGRIALTDLLIADQHRPGSWRDRVLVVMLNLSRIPQQNMIQADAYRHQLEQAGFDAVNIRDISGAVLPGFAAWWQRYRTQSGAPTAAMPWAARWKYAITARFLSWAYRHKVLRYCVITADRRSTDPLAE